MKFLLLTVKLYKISKILMWNLNNNKKSINFKINLTLKKNIFNIYYKHMYKNQNNVTNYKI